MTNSDLSAMEPKPSALQLMLRSTSLSRIRFTFVTPFMVAEEPLTGKYFMTITESPSTKTFPFESLTIKTITSTISSRFH